MRVLIFGTYDQATHPRVGVLAEGLAAHGHTIVTCNVPLGLTTAERLETLRRPWRVPAFAFRLLTRWLVLSVRARRVVRRRGAPDLVVVGYLGQFDIHLARLLFRRTPIVLDYMVSLADTARDRGTNGVRRRLLQGVDSAALKASALPVVDTDEDLAVLPTSARARAVVVPVGAPGWWFNGELSARANDEPLRVVFFGLYTPLQGTVTIGEALNLLRDDPTIEVTMIGNGQDHDATFAAARANPRVRWIDWLDAHELARTVHDHDVCLGIFGTSDKARRVVPNKVFQGAAAACAVVTSDTPPQRRTLDEAGVFVSPGSPVELASKLRQLAADRAFLMSRRRAAYERARSSFMPWVVTRPLETHLQQRLGPDIHHDHV